MARNLLPFDKDVLAHLRLPFSFFLLPVFLFGISQCTSNIHARDAWVAFVVLHFFIYTGSNGYNSYMDQDEGPIGGLEHPPPATRKLYYATIWVDVAGVLLSFIAGWQLALLVLGYVGFSKAYSWTGIRLKKYPVLGWISVSFFQGAWTYLLAGMAAAGNYHLESWLTRKEGVALFLATLLIGAYYPLTQIYQHGEDSGRGDRTISVLLGVQGTLLFSALLFAVSGAVAGFYFLTYYNLAQLLIFAGCLLPVLAYFLYWTSAILKNPANADYRHAMRNTRLSATCCVVCFCVLGWMNHWRL